MSAKALDFGSRRLRVKLDFGAGAPPIVLGECLWVASERLAAFQWSEEAVASGLNLSPMTMPLDSQLHFANHAPFNGLHALFSDSVPDGFGLRLMDKGLAAAGYDRDAVTPLHRLAWVGQRGVGALTYAPAIDGGGARELMDIAVAADHAAKAEAENFKNVPKSVIRAGGSALGARPKFWAAVGADGKIIVGDSPAAPSGFEPCLLKFAPSKGDRNEPYFEAACLELADAHGVGSARSELVRHPNGAALAVHRFDRKPGGGRVFTQSVAALLNLDFRSPSIDYASLAQLAQRLSGDADLERLYRQACFNVALSMRDDHCKNFAFCMDGSGAWELSPAFDLCPSSGFGFGGEHTTTLLGKGDKITRNDLVEFARSMGLSQAVADDGIEQSRAAADEFEAKAVGLGATKTGARTWAKRFKEIGKELAPAMVQGGIAPSAPPKPRSAKPPGKGRE